MSSVTDLLNRARSGDRDAGDAAFAAIYDELKHLALGALGRGPQHTLSATALVNEAYLKLVPGQQAVVSDRRHFFRTAARAMRQILVDYARRRSAEKRGGDWVRTEITENLAAGESRTHDLIAIDQALTRLEARDSELAAVVEAHFFAGLTFEEIAAERGVSDRSVRRDWETARVMLLHDLRGAPA
jgi:RNA polymerase sigma factor (TIGR02999 family)